MDRTPNPASGDEPSPRASSLPLDLSAVIEHLAQVEHRVGVLEARLLGARAPIPAARPPLPAPVVRPTAPPPTSFTGLPAGYVVQAPVEQEAVSVGGWPAQEPPAAVDLGPPAALAIPMAVSEQSAAAVPPVRWAEPRPLLGSGLGDLSSIGPARLLAWVGGAALVLGAVFFLSLAFANGWITPEMRVLLGLGGGAGLLGLAVVTFDRRQPALAHVLAASGIAILELALYASHLYGLAGSETALVGTALVAAAATAIAIRFDAQVVAALGLLAVLAAPPIMQAPATLVTVGFLLLVLVAASVVSAARGWRWLPWISFGVTLPQLVLWLNAADASAPTQMAALLGYWVVLVAPAVAEMRLRPRPLRQDASSALVVLVDAVVVVLIVLAGSTFRWEGLTLVDLSTRTAGITLAVLAAGHLVVSLPLLRREPRDAHGQLIIALGAPCMALGLALALPGLLVPVGWALLALVLGWQCRRFGHGFAQTEGLAVTGLVAGWVGLVLYPVTTLSTVPFPPIGAGGYPTLESLFVVGALLALLAAALRLAARSRTGRSLVAALGVLLVGWMLPFQTTGLALIAAWVALATGTTIAAARLGGARLARMVLPTDPLLLAGALAGAVAILWSTTGFPSPVGVVDLLAPVLLERLAASMLPIVGSVIVLAALRPRWWRGLTAALALVLGTAAVWLAASDASVAIGGAGVADPLATIQGPFIVLVGWPALALLALVLDERPRLRLASPRLLTTDPMGHPLALMALLPAAGTVAWLVVRFLGVGAGGSLPETPFTDEMTIATALVVVFLLVGARAARTRLVAGTLLATAVVLVAVLLPLQVALEYAVVGWSVMAGATFLVARRLEPTSARAAAVLGAGLLTAALGATFLRVAPPDRLVLELTASPPTEGPPNAATLATLAIGSAIAVGAWCAGVARRLAPWLWLAAGGVLAWGLSVGIADSFAVRIPGGADPVEMARQAQVALSITWAVLGLGTMLAGLVADVAPARQAGLALLTVATVKVFVYDLATLDVAYRVLSLMGLGVLLLVSAWLYLHARHHGGPQPMGR